MAPTGSDLQAELAKHVHYRFWDDMRRQLRQNYTETHARLRELLQPQLATNLRGTELLQRSQQILYQAANKYEGLSARILSTNPPGYYYTRVKAGPFVFTIHYSAFPGQLIKPTGFTRTLAADPSLFALTSSDDDTAYYGALLHSANFVYTPEFRVEFGKLLIGFPNQSCTRYVALFDPRSAYKMGATTQESVAVVDEALPKLKSNVKREAQ